MTPTLETNKIRLMLIKQEIKSWESAIELLTIRYHVNMKIGDENEAQACKREMEKSEIAISELKKMEQEFLENDIHD